MTTHKLNILPQYILMQEREYWAIRGQRATLNSINSKASAGVSNKRWQTRLLRNCRVEAGSRPEFNPRTRFVCQYANDTSVMLAGENLAELWTVNMLWWISLESSTPSIVIFGQKDHEVYQIPYGRRSRTLKGYVWFAWHICQPIYTPDNQQSLHWSLLLVNAEEFQVYCLLPAVKYSIGL